MQPECTGHDGDTPRENPVYGGDHRALHPPEKTEKYSDLAQSHVFIPACIETMGAWGPEAMKLIAEIGKRMQANTGEARSIAYLRQSISMVIQRGNVTSVLGTLPSLKQLEEIYYLVG